MPPVSTPTKPRRISEEEARAFCLPLIKNDRPLCIKRVPGANKLKVTFFHASSYINVEALLKKIEQDPKNFEVLARGEMVQFVAPFDLVATQRLITSFKK